MTDTSFSPFVFREGPLCFTFQRSGDLYEALAEETTLINQQLPHALDGALNNIYLRRHRPDCIEAVPLLGLRSPGRLYRSPRSLIWDGRALGVEYEVEFMLSDRGVWFWRVRLNAGGGDSDPADTPDVDLIYGQDIGLANRAAVRNNEAYVCQYLDHTAYSDKEKGWVLCFRQNQPQHGGRFPYLQQGALTGAVGFSTDGFQFFGLSAKETGIPERLRTETLADEIYQYEFAYAALATPRLRLNEPAEAVFYGLFRPDHAAAVTEAEYGDIVAAAWSEAGARERGECTEIPRTTLNGRVGSALTAEPLTEAELSARYPRRLQEERDAAGKLLAFFTPDYEHVVLKAKELIVERPHGHILLSGEAEEPDRRVMSTTSYMYGVFNSQLTVGNTTFNKLLSTARNPLNLLKASGQRIYVELGGRYRLLALPSLFELGFHYARWIYKTAEEEWIVTNCARTDGPETILRVEARSGRSYRYLVTHQMILGESEGELPYLWRQSGDGIEFRPDSRALCAREYPELVFRLTVQGSPLKLGDERLLLENAPPADAPLAVMELEGACWSLAIQGSLEGGLPSLPALDFLAERDRYRNRLGRVMNGFKLDAGENESDELERLDIAAWWYTHNMLVHFAAPHGLEQYNGAAWGTRDVCQGPLEFFLAVRHEERARTILLTLYSHQYEEPGDWPQWFMFDRYFRIQQADSHGDVIVWPLKALADYLNVTGDLSILQEPVPYTDRGTYAFTEQRPTLLEHVRKQVACIRSRFLPGTALSAYGDGDWDDTLQPADPRLKRSMASSWTVALTYQALDRFSRALEQAGGGLGAEWNDLAERIRGDFRRFLLTDGVIPGFLLMEDREHPRKMLHPDDADTGIRFRLLPMTRSIIAELLSPEEAETHLDIIRRHLLFPDGVRLMDRAATYRGGVSSRFKRAEQASNFGREIGLLYVHAHIRYVEAMAKLGQAEEAWTGLACVNPVGLAASVPHAEPRQSNAYFSSSDGRFKHRYEAEERFAELKTGRIPVKGGWRIYSSGPGIFLHQLISQLLGIRLAAGDLVVDPVLPARLEGARFRCYLNGAAVEFHYGRSSTGELHVTVNGRTAPGEPVANPYRPGGIRIAKQWLVEALTDDANRIDIAIPWSAPPRPEQAEAEREAALG